MGDFLSTPNKEKESEDNENNLVNIKLKQKPLKLIWLTIKVRYGACGMQGWRKRMEDSHISDIGIAQNNGLHLFGVFDGHGGKEVSQYVKKHFTNEFTKSKNFKNANYKSCLIETFLKMDEIMMEPNGKMELKQFAKQSKEEDDLRNAKEKNKQMDLFKQLFDYKGQEDCDVAMMTGCTANVCAIDQNGKKLYFANSGDSRVVLCKNGVAYPMSEDHKPDNDGEKNRIYKADGWVSEGRVKGILNILIYWYIFIYNYIFYLLY